MKKLYKYLGRPVSVKKRKNQVQREKASITVINAFEYEKSGIKNLKEAVEMINNEDL